MFDLPFEEIATIIGRSEAATRQMASRARRRIRGVKGAPEDGRVKREVVSAFLAASRSGDFNALLQLLDPEVVLDADEAAVEISARNAVKGAPRYDRKMSGAKTVGELFHGKATAVRLALIDDSVGATFMLNQTPLVAFTFTVKNGRISHIGVIMDRGTLRKSDIRVIERAQ
jgi:RNA polymerase sigma-70 factor (ECF subfamily)